MFGVARSLSVTTAGSSIKASLGAVSGVVVVVTHSGAPPVALVATQFAGRAGAVTPSKFSFNTVPPQLGDAVAVAVAVPAGVEVAVEVAVGVGETVPPTGVPFNSNGKSCGTSGAVPG